MPKPTSPLATDVVSVTSPEPDLLVIGGGAAGISAAQAARRRGASVVLVQEGPVGGDCTFTGCVPSKTLLAAAAAGAGFELAMATVRGAVERIAAQEDDTAMQRQGIEVRHGRAVLRSRDRVDVGGTEVRPRRIILATGAQPSLPPIPGLAGVNPLTNDTLFDLRRQPASLAILGGGSIGVEMAQAFGRLGTRVTLVEAEPRLLSREDRDAASVVNAALRRDGVDVRAGVQVESAIVHGAGVRLHLADRAVVEAERLLVATGRRPVSSGLGLEHVGVQVDDRGFIVTDAAMRTSVRGIWAIGDVTDRPQLTHAAGRMGLIAADNALAPLRRIRPKRFDERVVPHVTFTDPEVAQVGLTEAAAAAVLGPRARVAVVPFEALDRAVTAGRTEGFLKLIAGPRRLLGHTGGGQVVGATVVGPGAGELVHELALAMQTRMFTGRLAQTIHAYPSWSIAVQTAAAQLFFDVDGRGHRPPIAD